jgi:SAM-dependent methyltransferase
MAFPTLGSVEAIYRDEVAVHAAIHQAFTESVQASPALRRHRDHVEQNNLGFGDRAFHWLWKLLVDAMPVPFRFLEIGVFKGQVVSLVGMLALQAGKDAFVFGITPLNGDGDKYLTFDPATDYAAAIRDLQDWSGIPLSRQARILCGHSTDDGIKAACRSLAPFDLVYIDGCHDFHAVVNDIIVYGELVRPGGYLVMDDASTDLQLPPDMFSGIADVVEACRRVLEPDARFAPVCAVGHNRVWRRQVAA